MPEYSWEASPAQQEIAGGPDLREYLRILLKFKWGIISLALLSGLIGLYVAYRAVPIYRSTATLQIERDGGPMLGNLLLNSYQSEFYTTQYELIRSWSVAEMAAENLGLLDADHLEGETTAPGAAGFSWQALIPEFLKMQAPPMSPEVRRNKLITKIQDAIVVKPVEKSELSLISVENSDAAWAARVANEVAKAYINFLRDKNLADSTGKQSWYASRLNKARVDLEQAEHALQDFLDSQGLIQTAEGVDALQSQALQVALSRREEARQQKLALERTYRDIRAARSSDSLETVTALESRGIVKQLKNNLAEARQKVAQLSGRYGLRHPRMIELQSLLEAARKGYQEELEAVASAVVADYQRAMQTEAGYSAQLNEAQADIQSLNRSRAGLTKLQDDVKSSRALFEQLQSGEKAAGLLEGGTQNINAVIIEYARPGIYPVRPDKQRMVLMWVLVGMFTAIALAFLLNKLDGTFKGSEEVERRLALPVLGMLPQLKVGKGEELAPMYHYVNQGGSEFSEAIRTIRTGFLLSTPDKDRSIIAVTSSIPGEGKTTLAVNLAHAMRQMKKTLLIDADMRRPMVHMAENRKAPQPGLAALVTGEASLEEVLQEQEDGLHVIQSGRVPPNPLELLASKRFKSLLEQLQAEYEVIVIDSAPTLVVSDALVVAQLADALLYVVRADATPYRTAEQGLVRLRRVNAPMLGVVLNQVTLSGCADYGRYGRYQNYYRHDDCSEYYGAEA